MKKLIGVLFISLVVMACTPVEDYKMTRGEVMKFHDLVMADHGLIVENQMKLDTLVRDLEGLKAKFPAVDTLKEKEVILALIKDLSTAEDGMNDWMHQFEPDVTGKSNEDAVKYFKDEKVKIAAVDSLYKKEIALSNAYLERFKK